MHLIFSDLQDLLKKIMMFLCRRKGIKDLDGEDSRPFEAHA
jgi:hypothetical protein